MAVTTMAMMRGIAGMTRAVAGGTIATRRRRMTDAAAGIRDIRMMRAGAAAAGTRIMGTITTMGTMGIVAAGMMPRMRVRTRRMEGAAGTIIKDIGTGITIITGTIMGMMRTRPIFRFSIWRGKTMARRRRPGMG